MNKEISNFIASMSIDAIYVVVSAPFVECIREYEWFNQECFVHHDNSDEDELDCAYFAPLVRLLEIREHLELVAFGFWTNFYL